MKKLSIVVPVYNSEKYLKKCVDSILKQPYENIELILVDDGSVDSSPQICDNYALEDSRVKVIHEENAGISQARNNGINIATGYYLTFADNDDYVDKDIFITLINCIEANNVDYAECGVNLVFKESIICDHNYPHNEFIFDTKQGLEMFDEEVRPYVWNKVFIREKAQGIQFRDGYGEDRYFALDYLVKNNRFMYISKPMYYWNRTNENSFTRSKFNERNLTYVDFYKYMADICYKYNLSDKALKYEKDYFTKLFVYYAMARRYKVANYKEHMKSFYNDFHKQYSRAMEVTENKLLRIGMFFFNRIPRVTGYFSGVVIGIYRNRRNKMR